MVIITHEMAVIKAICDKVAVIEDGKSWKVGQSLTYLLILILKRLADLFKQLTAQSCQMLY